MKKVIIGLVIGLLLGSATTAYAATGSVTATFEKFNVLINGKQATLDTTPLVYNGTSYLPVREISNLLGYDVTYKSDTQTIELEQGSETVSSSTNITNTTSVTDATYTPDQIAQQQADLQAKADKYNGLNSKLIRDKQKVKSLQREISQLQSGIKQDEDGIASGDPIWGKMTKEQYENGSAYKQNMQTISDDQVQIAQLNTDIVNLQNQLNALNK